MGDVVMNFRNRCQTYRFKLDIKNLNLKGTHRIGKVYQEYRAKVSSGYSYRSFQRHIGTMIKSNELKIVVQGAGNSTFLNFGGD
jgi:hypothetical protein